VVPAYQEARRLPGLIRAVETHARDDLAGAGLRLVEVIVVDDRSRDGTGAIAAGAAARVPLLRALTAPPGRRGKGHAIRHGIGAAEGDLVLLADVDLSAPLSETRKLAAGLERGADVAVGSRALAGAHVEDTPAAREVMGRAFNALVRAATGLGLRDTQCPLKLLPTALARSLVEEQLAPGFAFDVELLLRARRRGARIVEVPIEFHHDRDSRVRPLASALSMGFDVLRLSLRLRGKRERHPRGEVRPAPDEPRLEGQQRGQDAVGRARRR
jgi:dolichyl-phosphate beta-glucosyltransferase